MVTAVSGFIEQVGSMITGSPKHNNKPASQPVSVHMHLSAYISVRMHPSAGYYPVWNQIIAGRWMRMNWYTLASRQVSLLAL